jgi:hypothetical protein
MDDDLNIEDVVSERSNKYTFPFGGVTLEVDVEATRSVYSISPLFDCCQCAGCTNFRLAKSAYFPKGMRSVLSGIGVDPLLPVSSEGASEGRKVYGFVRRTGFYVVVGRLMGGQRSGRWYDDERARSFIWADASSLDERWHEMVFHGRRVPHHFLMRFSILMPWLPEYIPMLDGDPGEARLAQYTRAWRLYWQRLNAAPDGSGDY